MRNTLGCYLKIQVIVKLVGVEVEWTYKRWINYLNIYLIEGVSWCMFLIEFYLGDYEISNRLFCYIISFTDFFIKFLFKVFLLYDDMLCI